MSEVREIGAALPDVEVTTTWGAMALKVRGQMFVCVATHKSAEPNTLVVVGAPVADWTERPRPPRTAMRGRYCRVEALVPEIHAPGLHRANQCS
jgi:hypothetical protein